LIPTYLGNVPLGFENGKEKESEKKVGKLFGFNGCPLLDY
jgi:hypothetical protein